MISSRLAGGYLQRGLALSVTVGVMLSLFVLRASAQSSEEQFKQAEVTQNTPAVNADSHFAWSVRAEIDANYVWRGLYSGGLSLQTEADVSYYGFFVNMWWNVGATDWKWGKRDAFGKPITGINPEVDVSLGYRYKGLMIQFMHMYYFDHYADGRMSQYFDWRNYPKGGGGVTTEWRIAYRISDKVPLRLMWCTRTFGRDGYIEDGELKRAYSTYIEARYDQPLPLDFTLTGVIGVTPWRSMYTGFEKKFAVVNLMVAASKSWKLTEYCSVDVGAAIVFNPSSMQPLWNIVTGVTFN